MRRNIRKRVILLAAALWMGTLFAAATVHSPASAAMAKRYAAEPGIAGIDVLIDPGHGGIDGGTSYGDLLEKDINLAVSLKLYEHLQKKGIGAALTRSADYTLSDDNRWLHTKSRHRRDLAQRKLAIDVIKPKLAVSIHANWAKDSAERGPSALYQASVPESKKAAELLVGSLNRLYGTRGAAIKGKTYFILKRTASPTVIVEIGFISNHADRSMMTSTDGQNQIAAALAAAIEQYLKSYESSAIPQ
jgi:N-acetylmuramoyl-L-alanine amidase